MIRRPPESTRTDTLFPYSTLFRSTVEFLIRTVDAEYRALAVRPGRIERYRAQFALCADGVKGLLVLAPADIARSEEHTSELQSLMRISYAVFCLKKKNNRNPNTHTQNTKY